MVGTHTIGLGVYDAVEVVVRAHSQPLPLQAASGMTGRCVLEGERWPWALLGQETTPSTPLAVPTQPGAGT